MQRLVITSTVIVGVAALAFVLLPAGAGMLRGESDGSRPIPLKAETERQKTPAKEEATPEPEVKREEPKAEKEIPDKCIDGSKLTVTGRDGYQVRYKCEESGAEGVYVKW